MVIERKCINIHEAVMLINVVVAEFHNLKKDLSKVKRDTGCGNKNELERWIKPKEGWFKVNCDGAFDSTSKAARIGIIVRSGDGGGGWN